MEHDDIKKVTKEMEELLSKLSASKAPLPEREEEEEPVGSDEAETNFESTDSDGEKPGGQEGTEERAEGRKKSQRRHRWIFKAGRWTMGCFLHSCGNYGDYLCPERNLPLWRGKLFEDGHVSSICSVFFGIPI